MLLLLPISLFFILWFAFGGLRSPLGKVLMVFSSGIFLFFGYVALLYFAPPPKNTSTNTAISPIGMPSDLEPCPNKPNYYMGVDGHGCE